MADNAVSGCRHCGLAVTSKLCDDGVARWYHITTGLLHCSEHFAEPCP